MAARAWIKPVRQRLVIGGLQFGSKYKTIFQEKDFCLQERKANADQGAGHRSKFRIITSGDKDYFEIAYSDSLPEVQWAYLTEHLLEKLPPHIADNEKARLQWIVARCQQLWLESHDPLDPQEDDEDCRADSEDDMPVDKQNLRQSSTASDDKGSGGGKLRRRAVGSTVAGIVGRERDNGESGVQPINRAIQRANTVPPHSVVAPERESVSSDTSTKRYRERSEPRNRPFGDTPRRSSTKKSVPVVNHRSAVVINCRGFLAYIFCALSLNTMLLLVHDCGQMVFHWTMLSVNVVLLILIGMGWPMSLQLIAQGQTQNPSLTQGGFSEITTDGKRKVNKKRHTTKATIGDRASATEGGANLPRQFSSTSTTSTTSITEQDEEELPSGPPVLEWSTPGPPIRLSDVGAVPTNSREAFAKEPMTWHKMSGENFNVRIGPNYKKNKLKKPSLDGFFDPISVDTYVSEKKTGKVGDQIKLPKLPLVYEDFKAGQHKDGPLEINGVPTLLIVTWTMPYYSPGVPTPFGGKEDGEGLIVVVKFAMTRKLKEELQSKEELSPATALLKRFCQKYEVKEVNARLKLISKLCNPDELNLGSIASKTVEKYNSKPFLTGPRCHTVSKGNGYLEINCDMHRYGYVFRQGVWAFLDYIPQMCIELGLVIQGDEDHELPERALACVAVAYPRPKDRNQKLIL